LRIHAVQRRREEQFAPPEQTGVKIVRQHQEGEHGDATIEFHCDEAKEVSFNPISAHKKYKNHYWKMGKF
jgi:hypothetical protein